MDASQVYIPKTESPLVQLGAALEVAGRMREHRAAQEADQEQAAVKQALSLYPNDPDQAVSWLSSAGHPSAAMLLQGHVAKTRAAQATALETTLKNRKAQADIALGLLSAAQQNPAAWPYVLKATEALAPQLRPLLPNEPPDQATMARLLQAGMTAKEISDWQEKALDAFRKGEYHAAASQSLGWTVNQEGWDEAMQGLRALGVPSAVLAQFGATWSPENALAARGRGLRPKEAADVTLTAEQQAETARSHRENEKTARGNLWVAQQNLQLRREEVPLETVIGKDGKPVLARRSEAVGKTPAPSSPGAAAKAGPDVGAILDNIQTLSQRINTSGAGPWANVKGRWRGAMAAVNWDNDVSEYTSLVEGMIPMVARAVGHTGVLTQQDVDSVRALFPRVTDNKTLAQNKLKRVRSLMKTKAGLAAMAGQDLPTMPEGYVPPAAPARGMVVEWTTDAQGNPVPKE